MQRPAPSRRHRWLLAVACLFVWTSADGDRQCGAPPPPARRAIVRTIAPPPPSQAPPIEFYYPAEPQRP